MTSLDTLSNVGTELTGTELETVDGGILPVIIVANTILKGVFIYLAVTG